MTQATKQCACCGTINYADAQVCGGCGQYFAVPAVATIYCAYCGTPLDSTAPFCGRCGNPAHTTAVSLTANPPKRSKAKWWIVGIAIFLSVSLLISALFNFVINPYLEDLQISSSAGDDKGGDHNDGGNDHLGGITGGYSGNRTTRRTTQRTAICTTAARDESSNTATQAIPSLYQITGEIQQKGYYMAYDYTLQNEDLGMDGVVSAAAYDGVRYFDEYGNTYGMLMDEWDYGIETVRVMYVVFDSAAAAQNAYRYLIADSFFDASYRESVGTNYARAWQNATAYGSDYGKHQLLSRRDNVLVAFWVDWDDYKDAGMAYDNAAYGVVEGLGF